jgi:hypothetical protein
LEHPGNVETIPKHWNGREDGRGDEDGVENLVGFGGAKIGIRDHGDSSQNLTSACADF